MDTQQDKFVCVRDLVNLIDDITQCPICLERVKSPLFQCINGHVTCGQCKDQNQQKNCALCGLKFIVTPPRILAQLLDAFSKTCKFSSNGCSVPFVVDSHEQLCEYRPIKCWVGQDRQCRWTGTVRDWQEHVQQNHKIQTCNSGVDDNAMLKYYNFQKWNSFGYFFTIHNTFFLLYAFKHSGMFYQNVRVIPVTSIDTYLVNISLELTDANGVETAFAGTFEPSVLSENDDLEDTRNMAGVFIPDIEDMIANEYLPVTISVRKKNYCKKNQNKC